MLLSSYATFSLDVALVDSAKSFQERKKLQPLLTLRVDDVVYYLTNILNGHIFYLLC